jgi:formamidopyrimidine-DNA glycosylase
MPELPEVERARRELLPAMDGARFVRVRLNRPDLRTPFPPHFAERLTGNTVLAVTRRGKYLLAHLSSSDILVMHLGMSGWFRVEPTSRRRIDRETDLERRHDHVIFTMSSGMTVTFNDPRRFGLMDLLPAGAEASVAAGNAWQTLGPEPLTPQFTGETLAGACAGRTISLKVALLDQRIVAGVGNIYASEALHLAGLSPFRRASTIATTTGRARPSARRLAAALKSVLRRAIARSKNSGYRNDRFRVYDREGQPCPTPGCRGVVERSAQAGRSTFWCRVCQR